MRNLPYLKSEPGATVPGGLPTSDAISSRPEIGVVMDGSNSLADLAARINAEDGACLKDGGADCDAESVRDDAGHSAISTGKSEMDPEKTEAARVAARS